MIADIQHSVDVLPIEEHQQRTMMSLCGILGIYEQLLCVVPRESDVISEYVVEFGGKKVTIETYRYCAGEFWLRVEDLRSVRIGQIDDVRIRGVLGDGTVSLDPDIRSFVVLYLQDKREAHTKPLFEIDVNHEDGKMVRRLNFTGTPVEGLFSPFELEGLTHANATERLFKLARDVLQRN